MLSLNELDFLLLPFSSPEEIIQRENDKHMMQITKTEKKRHVQGKYDEIDKILVLASRDDR